MKKLLASALAVSMVAGLAVSANAAGVNQLRLAGELGNAAGAKDAYYVDYKQINNRDSFEFPDNWGNDGYESGKIAPVLVYGDTKEYNVLVANLPESAKVHVSSGRVRATTRKYEAKEADHDGNVYPTTHTMENAYSAVDQFEVPVTLIDSISFGSKNGSTGQYPGQVRTRPDSSRSGRLSNGETNGQVDEPANSSGANLDGTTVVNGVSQEIINAITDRMASLDYRLANVNISFPSALGQTDISGTPTDDQIFIRMNGSNVARIDNVGGAATLTYSAPNTAAYVLGTFNDASATATGTPINVKLYDITSSSRPVIRPINGAQKAKAYIGTRRVDGEDWLVAAKDYTYYTNTDTTVVQFKVAKDCYVDTEGRPVDASRRVRAAQYAYNNNLNTNPDDTNLGGVTIDKGTNGLVITIKSNHGPRDTKIEDFKIEVDVSDGNTFFIEGASGYSNIREVVDDDRLTNQEDDDKGCVYNFGQKIYETARIRCTDYVDLYFNGNYDTSRENLRVSTDEIAEIKSYFADYDIDYVNFIARPKFATPATVIIDADKNSYIYEYDENTGDVKLMNDDKATYDSTDGWKFKDNTLGIYLIFEEEYENSNVKADKNAPIEEPEEPEEPSTSEAPSTSTEKPNPGTGANDMVGAAAALAVVSLVAAGTVAVKKLSK